MAAANMINEQSRRGMGWLATWLSFAGQILLVAALGSADDIAHALAGQSNKQLGLANAARVEAFEAAHDLWIEPPVQTFFTHAHDVLGTVIGYAQMVPVFNAIYGVGHVGITFLFALWMFRRRRPLFAFVRNIFLFLNALAIMTYELFPLAPPRLARAFPYDGHPYHFLDPTFNAGNGLKLGFNEFAAMPSLHVGWSLIVALTLFFVVRAPILRLLALAYPLLMLTTVIVTGNHYVSDALGAVAALAVATAAALFCEWLRGRDRSFGAILRRLNALRYCSDEGRADQIAAEPLDAGRRSAA